MRFSRNAPSVWTTFLGGGINFRDVVSCEVAAGYGRYWPAKRNGDGAIVIAQLAYWVPTSRPRLPDTRPTPFEMTIRRSRAIMLG